MSSEIYNRYAGESYSSPQNNVSFIAGHFPSLYFYFRLLAGPVAQLCALAMAGRCTDSLWCSGSNKVAAILENLGCRIEITGLKILDDLPGPCVFVANHMSTLETFLLPGIIRPHMPMTFVVKSSLVKLPFFGPLMRSRNPVVVGRKNPREDLRTVLEEGQKRLDKGIAIVVFPQGTRSLYFNPDQFNTIGVKLALRANAPLVPIAIKSDVWGQGKRIKEAGKIKPDLPLRIKFGAPCFPAGSGKYEHQSIKRFISENLTAWQKEDGINI